MTTIDFNEQSHQRWNPLTLSWILCSPHRTKRPWQGQQEKLAVDERPEYDPKCYLCPGNTRAGGHANPNYQSTFTFNNDFPAVQSTITYKEDSTTEEDSELFRAEPVRGDCFVTCFNPNHKLTLAQMTVEQIVPVVHSWQDIFNKCIALPYVSYCQIFENKGEIMGCSNPHPHGQVWATEVIPEEPRKEINGLKEYLNKHKTCLLCDYVKKEIEKRARIVTENEDFIALVPWWATWPFETMILPKKHLKSVMDLTENLIVGFADIIRRVTCKYDNLFKCSFPYSMGLHQAPCLNRDATEADIKGSVDLFHLHMHFYPPLLRSATVKKFLVGFEMLGTPQRDLTAEQAAEKLRLLPEIHYSLQ